MSRIEELPDDFDESLNLNAAAAEKSSQGTKPTPSRAGAGLSFDAIAQSVPFPLPASAQQNASSSASTEPSAALPPHMDSVRQRSADEVLDMLNRTPLFMTSLDETDGMGGVNVELEALKALAYEGTRAEVAANFREQGNELARAKQWADAKVYYDKALAALAGPRMPQDREDGEGPTDVQVVELDEEEEERKEKAIEEACYVNRALCNLERKNHRACNLDCAAALRLNPTNIKAWYRASSACLALDKILEAEDSCARGLKIDPKNAALKTLATKISKRKQTIEEQENRRREREQRKMAEKHTLKLALKARNIPSRVTNERPDAEDAIMKLADPLDPSSTLSVPVIFLYPLHMQSDFIKAFAETETLGEHLSYILPLPWDEKGEYTPESVECYIETVAGGLIKAGKKLSLLKLLKSGKIEIVDGMLRVQVVPRSKAQGWIDDFKRRRLA